MTSETAPTARVCCDLHAMCAIPDGEPCPSAAVAAHLRTFIEMYADLRDERDALKAERDRLRAVVEAFDAEVERSREASMSRGMGGQQCGPSSADFAYIQPSIGKRLSWWVREMLAAMDGGK